MRFASERHGQHGAAVKRVFEADDGGPARVGAGDFHGVFDGFGAAIHQNAFFRERAGNERIQFFGEGDIFFVGATLKQV